MTYAENLWIFSALLFGIVIVPGMDSLFVMANALTGGRRLGFAAVFGLMLGGVFHTVFGAVGVSLILSVAPALVAVLLTAGAAYMVWIGYTLLRSSIVVNAVGTAPTRTWGTAFRQGVITCILNPKAYMFVIAVYPQFIKPAYGPVWSQALVMGTMTAAMQFGIYGALALAAGKSRDLMMANPKVTMLVGRLVGVVFVIAGLATAWEAWRT